MGGEEIKWNESGFRSPLCTYRLNRVRRTSWEWWDEWDDTVLQTQDSKFEPWRSEVEHATSRSRRLPTIRWRNNMKDGESFSTHQKENVPVGLFLLLSISRKILFKVRIKRIVFILSTVKCDYKPIIIVDCYNNNRAFKWHWWYSFIYSLIRQFINPPIHSFFY